MEGIGKGGFVSNYPDGVSPADKHFAGPSPEELEEQERLGEILAYLAGIQDAETELDELSDSLAWLDGNFPQEGRKTVFNRGYSFFLEGVITFRVVATALQARLRELRERTEDL